MSKLKELRERVERASGPDQHLDAEIASCLFGGEVVPVPQVSGGFVFKLRCMSRTGDGYAEQLVSPVTASIDAALALVEQVLPGAEYEITTLYCVAHVTLFVDAALPGRREDGHVPLAIVTALLRTVEAKGGHDG